MPLLKIGFIRRATLIVVVAILSIVAAPSVVAADVVAADVVAADVVAADVVAADVVAAETKSVAASSNKVSLERASEALRIAMVEGDGELLNSVLHDRVIYMHSSGRSQTKADLLEQMAGKHFFASLEYTDQIVEVVDYTGIVTVTVDQVKNLAEGKTRASRIKVMYSWVYSEGNWKLLGRTSAIIHSPLYPR